ncbi:MAG: aldehyde-activating protein [Sphingomonas sp. 28-62-20]|uniref:GFA family protein n=1 Tax=Sphingomonas sp. 28-62-20 TaxID=1970433 RepID=UPI000BC5FECB|nr:MAG: aldehyde-activating protein [Sphingomonas sp. 28-62-20]
MITEHIGGGCRCGACRYTLAVDTMPPVYACHCQHCQTWSGSAFTEQAMIRSDAITAAGPIVEYAAERPSGGVSTQHVCSVCHTRLWNTNTVWPAMAVVRAGTLDAAETLSPLMHIWTKRKQPWLTIDPAVPSFEENAPPAAFMKLMA